MTGPVPPPNVTFGHTKPFGTYVPLGPVFPVTTGAPVGPGALVPPRPGDSQLLILALYLVEGLEESLSDLNLLWIPVAVVV